MKINLYHRHYGVHSFVSEHEIDLTNSNIITKIPSTYRGFEWVVDDKELAEKNLEILDNDSRNYTKEGNSVYIFYSKANPKDPNFERDCMNKQETAGIKDNHDFVFDNYPEKFQRVYSDDANSTYIWKIL